MSIQVESANRILAPMVERVNLVPMVSFNVSVHPNSKDYAVNSVSIHFIEKMFDTPLRCVLRQGL